MAWWSPKKEVPDRLRICMVARRFPILGLTSEYGFLWPVARGLVRLGHQVSVLSWRSSAKSTQVLHDGVQAYFLGENESRRVEDFATLAEIKFAELHGREPFHLVHSVDSSGISIGRKKNAYRIAMAYDIEATHMSEIFSIMGMSQETLGALLKTGAAVTYRFLSRYLGQDRALLNTADAMFVASPAQQLALERYYLYPQLKTHIIPYGIDIGDLSPREKSEELKNKLKLPAEAQIVVAYSDMAEVGEIKSLLLAFEQVAIRKPLARLLMIGHGPKRKEIEFEMLSLALGGRVTFCGDLSGAVLTEHIALADVFVNLNSRSSGFEASNLEAMAQKKMVIGSEMSPMSTLIEDGRDGFLIRPADVQHLSEILLQVFNQEIATAPIGEAARSKVLKVFDTTQMLRLTEAAYRSALVQSGRFRSSNRTKDHRIPAGAPR